MNENTGELRLSCGCKIVVKPMSSSYVRCETHKTTTINNLKQMFSVAKRIANPSKYEFNPRKFLSL